VKLPCYFSQACGRPEKILRGKTFLPNYRYLTLCQIYIVFHTNLPSFMSLCHLHGSPHHKKTLTEFNDYRQCGHGFTASSVRRNLICTSGILPVHMNVNTLRRCMCLCVVVGRQFSVDALSNKSA